MEIEKKWMVSGWPRTEQAGQPSLPLLYTEYQEQGYVHADAPIVRIRMEARLNETAPGGQAPAKYILCFKSKGLLVREEIEIEISREDFQRLAALTGAPLIRKIRRAYQLPDGLTLEVNLVDEGLASEFMYAEVEFEKEAQARSWEPDSAGLGAYLAEDVTELPGQSMSAYWARTRLGRQL